MTREICSMGVRGWFQQCCCFPSWPEIETRREVKQAVTLLASKPVTWAVMDTQLPIMGTAVLQLLGPLSLFFLRHLIFITSTTLAAHSEMLWQTPLSVGLSQGLRQCCSYQYSFMDLDNISLFPQLLELSVFLKSEFAL